jgi:hypothetical protein
MQIYTYSSQYKDVVRAKEIKIFMEVIAACQGKLFSCHFCHTGHRIASPCPRPFTFSVRLHLLRTQLYTEKQEINIYIYIYIYNGRLEIKRSSPRHSMNYRHKLFKKIAYCQIYDVSMLRPSNSIIRKHFVLSASQSNIKLYMYSKLFLCII